MRLLQRLKSLDITLIAIALFVGLHFMLKYAEDWLYFIVLGIVLGVALFRILPKVYRRVKAKIIARKSRPFPPTDELLKGLIKYEHEV